MSLILRQSTSKAVSFGPFVDKTDGVTLEVGLVTAIDHATTGILLSKNGGRLTIRFQAVTASTYDAYGNYIVTLSATDTNTIGTLRMQFSEAATCLPVWQDFIVMDEATYDVLFGTVALATTTNITGGTITTVTNLTNAPTNGDLTATMKTSVTTAVPTAAVNAAAVWDLDATAHQTTGTFGQAIGDPVADTNTIYGAVVTGAAGATVAADIIAVKADTAAILLDTAEIGAAGAGLTNIGTIATVTNLTNLPAAAALEATLTAMKGATFAGATDSLEAIRDRGDAAWITATGFSTHSAADVWASVARTLTAVTNIVLAKGVGVTGFNDIAATAIVSAGAITTLSGAVANVDLVDVLTTYT